MTTTAMRQVVSLAVVLLGACSGGAVEPPATSPTAPTASAVPGPVAPPAPVAAWVAGIPVIEEGGMVPEAGEPGLLVTPNGLALAPDAAPFISLVEGRFIATDVQGGEYGFLVPSVEAALRDEGPAAPLTIAVDPSVPYMTVVRLVYSAGRAGLTSLRFAVRRGTERGVLPVEIPPTRAASAAENALLLAALGDGSVTELELDPPAAAAPAVHEEPEPEPDLVLTVTGTGISISDRRGRLAAGCAEIATTHDITVPRAADGQDLVALGRCLAAVRAAAPVRAAGVQESLMLSADHDLPFGEVARVLSFAHGTEAGAAPRMMLGAGVR